MLVISSRTSSLDEVVSLNGTELDFTEHSLALCTWYAPLPVD